jgi:NDP-sugar pyrophosphorylase family protein
LINTELPIKVLVLAGGKGTRLGRLTKQTPKPLLKLNKKITIIDAVLDGFAKADFSVKNICLNVCYQQEKLIKYVTNSISPHYFFAYQDEKWGTFGAVRHIKNWLSDTFIVVNGDTLLSLDIWKMIGQHFKDGNDITVFSKDTVYHSGGVYIFEKFVLNLTTDDLQDIPDLVTSAIGLKIGLFTEGNYLDCGTPEKLKQAREIYKDL